MSRVISIGRQDYEKLRMKNNFYVDKTHFIKEWWEADFRKLQGTYPVIFLSFADVKERDFLQARKMICRNIQELYNRFDFLLDEYDTPMQEAYVNGYWDDMSAFIRSLFNSTFKTNPYLERGLMTGITRISRESIFSDLNNLEVVTTISDKYTDCFGFTEAEVFMALDEYEMSDRKAEVKAWYDGFTFGDIADIYNPWSIIN